MNEHRDTFCRPEHVAMRNAPGAAVCVDEECDLSGGYAHVGPCEPCACGKQHAIDECPATWFAGKVVPRGHA